MNIALFETLKTFSEKLKYLSLELNSVSLVVDNILSDEKKYEIIEPLMNALISSTTTTIKDDINDKVDEKPLGLFVNIAKRDEMIDSVRCGAKIRGIQLLKSDVICERCRKEDGNIYIKPHVIGLKEAKDEIERVFYRKVGRSNTYVLGVDHWEFEGIIIYEESIEAPF